MEQCAVLGASVTWVNVSSGQAADCLGWSENVCGEESVRDRYGEEYVTRSWTESEERDRDDGGIWWFEDGIVGDGLVEYGGYNVTC
ncbi:hypothetical protein PR002_g1169 [Phytophthora rubi]|uniref:Uncharacterized protein n=1 Tax=Phytophthora rubi TaxID=129364 RepID=A0A6A3NV93_9STRA|nr:hypothetical protein PR002_g1169 [Phytophthora rubi]